MKSGKLNDVERTYIETKWKTLSTDDICKALGRGKRIVMNYITELQNKEAVDESNNAGTAKVLDPRIEHTRARSQNNQKTIIGSVSGRTFSELGDDFAKTLPKKNPYDNKAIRPTRP